MDTKATKINKFLDDTLKEYGYLPGNRDDLFDLLTRYFQKDSSWVGGDPRWFANYEQAHERIRLHRGGHIELVQLVKGTRISDYQFYEMMKEIARERHECAYFDDMYEVTERLTGEDLSAYRTIDRKTFKS